MEIILYSDNDIILKASLGVDNSIVLSQEYDGDIQILSLSKDEFMRLEAWYKPIINGNKEGE